MSSGKGSPHSMHHPYGWSIQIGLPHFGQRAISVRFALPIRDGSLRDFYFVGSAGPALSALLPWLG
jgi:hypothetical protein